MRRFINISALVVFVWLVLDAFRVPSAILDFLLVGAVPGVKQTIPADVMLVIFSIAAIAGVLVFVVEIFGIHLRLERLARRVLPRIRLPGRALKRL